VTALNLYPARAPFVQPDLRLTPQALRALREVQTRLGGEGGSAALEAIRRLTPRANTFPYFTSASAADLATVTAFARTLLDDETGAAMLTTLGVSAFIQTLLDDTTAAAARNTLGVTAIFDALNLATYTALRAYTGDQTRVYVTGYSASATPSGIAGQFIRDDTDTTTADNGGTVIVASNGKRWKRVFTGFYDVMWFGAKGNGSTNDTTAIQTAIDTISADGGGILWIPEGIYQLSSALSVPSEVAIYGAGLDSTILRMTALSTATEIIKNSPTAADLGSRNIVIQDLTIRGNSAVTAGILLSAVYRSTFERIRVQSITAAGAYGIKLQSWDDGTDWRTCSRNSFRDCQILDAPNSMHMTKASGDPNSHGSSFNLTERCIFAGYTDKGVYVEWGEHNSFYQCSATTGNDNTVAYYVNDTVCAFVACHADSTAGASLAATRDDWGFLTGVLDNSNTGWYFTDSAMGGAVITPGGNGCRKRVDFENWTAFYGTFMERHQYHWFGNARAGAWHSHAPTIADDGVFYVELGDSARHGRCDIISKDSSLSIRAAFYYRTFSLHAIQASADTTGITLAAADTTLTGTTGADGDFTVSAADNGLYFENRTGAELSVVINITSDNKV
jgi:hypothetical protein